jgi:hypothetical protein
MARFVKGSTVEVHFLDHTEDDRKAYEFVVYGRISHVDRRSITVDCWAYVEPKEKDRQNVTHYTILKSAITRWWRLGRK